MSTNIRFGPSGATIIIGKCVRRWFTNKGCLVAALDQVFLSKFTYKEDSLDMATQNWSFFIGQLKIQKNNLHRTYSRSSRKAGNIIKELYLNNHRW